MTERDAKAKSATVTLVDAQLPILHAAAQREDRCLERPLSLRGAQIAKVRGSLIESGYVREVRAKANAPVWRRDVETETAFALKLTAAGLKVATSERAPLANKQAGEAADAVCPIDKREPPKVAAAGQSVAERSRKKAQPRGEPRPSSKIATVIELLSRAEGATLAELIAATGWLPHTTRAALTGLRKRGYGLSLDRDDRQRGSLYRIVSKPDRDGAQLSERAVESA